MKLERKEKRGKICQQAKAKLGRICQQAKEKWEKTRKSG
jgi:hypothetical protein